MRTAALWLSVATLVAAAVFGGVLIVVGDQANIAGRVWFTLLLVAAFAGIVVLDGRFEDTPNRWYLPASTLLNILLVLIGLFKLWNGPLQPANSSDAWVWSGQFWRWIGLVFVVRIALLVTQFFVLQFVNRARREATKIAARVTVVLVWVTATVFILPLSFPNLEPLGIGGYADWWWRIAGATTLVMAVSVVIPLVVRAFEPRPPKQQSVPPVYGQQAPYGQAPFGQAPYGQAPYAQSPYGEVPYGQPQVYGAPSPVPPPQQPGPPQQ